MSKIIFQGAGTAIVTPMKEDFSINYPVFDRLLVRCAVRNVNARIPVIAGAGSNNTAHGVFLHFSACAEAVKIPVILYNVPSRTGVNIEPDTYKKLSEIENIAAVKEAGGNLSQMAKIISLCRDDLTVYGGNDDQITGALALGAQGVVSVLANLLPEDTHRICAHYFEGNSERSQELQLKYLKLIETLFLDVNPIPVKQALRIMGYPVGPCRLPLCERDLSFLKIAVLKIFMKHFSLSGIFAGSGAFPAGRCPGMALTL